MVAFKKVFGFCLIAFLGVPLLFGMIWAFGLAKAVTSPDFISNLPREILEDLPVVVEEISNDLESHCLGLDDEGRIWLKAYRDRGTDLNRIVRETGMERWVQNEVRNAFLEVGDVLRGERKADTVELDLRPLKNALRSPVLLDEMVAVIERLPPCSPVDEVWWQEQLERAVVSEGRTPLKLKPCRPSSLEGIRETLSLYLEREVKDIPDHVELLGMEEELPAGFDLARWSSRFLLLLFIVPALFVFLGSLIASDSRPGFLRWVGASTFVGGGLVFLLTSTVMRLLPRLMAYGPEFHLNFYGRDCVAPHLLSYLSELGRLLLQPVDKAATVVCVIGIVLVALSFAFTDRNKQGHS